MYVTVEGIDGAGTTSVSAAIVEALPDDKAVLVTEPDGDTWLGNTVREALQRDTFPITDLFLFLANRAEHVSKNVKPALEQGKVVVSDRGVDSTYAYQYEKIQDVYPKDIYKWLDSLHKSWYVEPSLTILIDVSAETGLQRASGDEKYEDEGLNDIADRYRELAERYSYRYVVIDGERPLEDVIEDAVDAVEKEL